MSKTKSFEEMAGLVIEAKSNGFDEAIFIGQVEALTIRWGGLHGQIDSLRIIDDGARLEFEGLPVYLVDAESYFRVA